MARRMYGLGSCVATALLAACGGDTESNGGDNSDGGSSGGGFGTGGETSASTGGAESGGASGADGTSTGGVESGGMGGAGSADTGGRAGSTGGVAGGGIAGANSAPVTYRACRWETEPRAIVVSSWDHETCVCTRLKLEELSECVSSVQAGSWCLQEAQITNDVANCEHRFSATGTQAMDATGSVSISMMAPWQLDAGVILTLHNGAGLPQEIAFETNDCWVSCGADCSTQESPPLPTSLGAVVRSYCGEYYEIEITDPTGFYVGAYDWVMDVGGTVFTRFRFGLGGSTYSLIYRISVAEFDALTDGAPITAWYGHVGAGQARELGVLDKALVEPG